MSRGASERLGRGAAAVALAATLTALAGCTEDMSDLRGYVAEVKQRPGGRIEPLPEIEPYATYTFPERPMRDPFAPLAFGAPAEVPAAAQNTGPRPDPTRPREALEDFQLDSLNYVGTLEQSGETWALIRAPGGTIHRVQEGNYLGQNHGRITDIGPREIEVKELVPTGQGGWLEREALIALND